MIVSCDWLDRYVDKVEVLPRGRIHLLAALGPLHHTIRSLLVYDWISGLRNSKICPLDYWENRFFTNKGINHRLS